MWGFHFDSMKRDWSRSLANPVKMTTTWRLMTVARVISWRLEDKEKAWNGNHSKQRTQGDFLLLPFEYRNTVRENGTSCERENVFSHQSRGHSINRWLHSHWEGNWNAWENDKKKSTRKCKTYWKHKRQLDFIAEHNVPGLLLGPSQLHVTFSGS